MIEPDYKDFVYIRFCRTCKKKLTSKREQSRITHICNQCNSKESDREKINARNRLKQDWRQWTEKHPERRREIARDSEFRRRILKRLLAKRKARLEAEEEALE